MNPTDTAQRFHLRDYDLTCSARIVSSGRYQAVLVVARSLWPSRPRTIAMQKGDFATAAAAIDAARAQGITWIGDFG